MRDGELIRRARWGARQGLMVALALCAAPMAQAQSVKPGLWEHSWSMKSTSGQMEKAMAQMKRSSACKQARPCGQSGNSGSHESAQNGVPP